MVVAFVDFKKNLKIGLSAIGKMYVVCALLTNARTCLYKSQTSNVSGVEPRMLEEYFNYPCQQGRKYIIFFICSYVFYLP